MLGCALGDLVDEGELLALDSIELFLEIGKRHADTRRAVLFPAFERPVVDESSRPARTPEIVRLVRRWIESDFVCALHVYTLNTSGYMCRGFSSLGKDQVDAVTCVPIIAEAQSDRQKRSNRRMRGAIAELSCSRMMSAMLRYVLTTQNNIHSAYSTW